MQPPSSTRQQSDPPSPPPYPLAHRSQRLAAALIDEGIALLWLIPLFNRYDIFAHAQRGEPAPLNAVIQISILAFLFFLLAHGYLLHRYGQTIGKRILRIAVATLDFQVPPFNRLIALRYLPFRVLGAIPGLAILTLLNPLFIFRQDRRCLHDHLAGTQVIYVGR
ncbi:MAG: RDD family protein [Cellvibrionales bacterium]|nr:RDD family protein [Cellvibrionales bacterium]